MPAEPYIGTPGNPITVSLCPSSSTIFDLLSLAAKQTEYQIEIHNQDPNAHDNLDYVTTEEGDTLALEE